MKAPGWWKLRSGHAKAVTVLALLLVLEFGLCAVFPLEGRFPAESILLAVSLATFVLLIVVLISWFVRSLLL
jgi:hypothetical protein